MNDLLTRYFTAFAAKDLTTLEQLYDEDIVLWEWKTNIFMGKEDVLAANQRLFETVADFKVLVKGHASADENKSFTELVILLDQQLISVVDVITTQNGKITSIAAYRGF